MKRIELIQMEENWVQRSLKLKISSQLILFHYSFLYLSHAHSERTLASHMLVQKLVILFKILNACLRLVKEDSKYSLINLLS